ncbi:hypothetical protein LSAT2_028744 [Lamellibrachia satsuma]|nr:hypothetical protein LSAT2_028744 [Lamellibrachia satsuma]
MVHSGYKGPSPGRQLVGHSTCGGPSPGSRPKVMTTPPSASFMCSGQKHKLTPVEDHIHITAMQNRSGGFVGASRLSVRTPPSNGRMGGIPHTPSPNSLSLTPGDAMQAMTPCRSANVQGYSPMVCSPAFGRRSNVHAGKIGLAFLPVIHQYSTFQPKITPSGE